MGASVVYKDLGEHFTADEGHAEIYFSRPKYGTSWGNYINEAKGILDKASKNTNPLGISILLGAMADLVSRGYYSKHNQK